MSKKKVKKLIKRSRRGRKLRGYGRRRRRKEKAAETTKRGRTRNKVKSLRRK